MVFWVDKIMQGRTFLRIMFDSLFVNNPVCKAFIALVNFCNEHSYFNNRKLKFSQKIPLNNIENDNSYKTKFIFKSTHKIGVDYK